MNGFEIFGDHAKTLHPRHLLELPGHVAHQVFDKLGVFIGAFSYVFFIGALEQAPQLSRCLFFDRLDKPVEINMSRVIKHGTDGYMRTLIMCAVV